MTEALTAEPLVYVVTVAWNRQAETLRALASLSEMTYPNYRIVLVDNGSSDGTADAVGSRYPQVALIVHVRNLGFQRGFNAGIDYALAQRAEYVFIVNNDTVVAPNILTELLRQAGPPDVGILGPKIYWADEPGRICSVGGRCHPITMEWTAKGENQLDLGQWSTVIERDYLSGCAMLLRRSLIERIGYFDTCFDPAYYEDADLCVRARQAGFRLLLVPSAHIWHRGSASSGGWGSPGERYLMARNSVIFFRRYVHGWRRLILVPYRFGSAIKTTVRLLYRGRADSAGAYWQGLRDGLWPSRWTPGTQLSASTGQSDAGRKA